MKCWFKCATLIFIFFICKIKNSKCYVLKSIEIKGNNKIKTLLNDNNSKIIKQNKIKSYSKLLRTSNILPTFLLNILAGWLTIPNYKLFLNKQFWAFSLITQLTMMNSMVINDLFDLKIDLINNNNRPLVNKEITIKEAQCLYISTNIVIGLLSTCFFNEKHFYKFIYAINLMLFLYTPYLKKILFIKNITCASVVSSTLVLTSKSISLYNYTPYYSSHVNLIDILSRFLFLSSIYIELLLDVKDMHGDRENNIVTIPNYFGIKKTYNLLMILFTGNLLYYSIIFYRSHYYKLFIGFILANIHFFKNLFALLQNNNVFTEKQILTSVKETTVSLIIFIICLLLPF